MILTSRTVCTVLNSSCLTLACEYFIQKSINTFTMNTNFEFYSKDVRLPVQLQRAMAAEAEAAREARAKVSTEAVTTVDAKESNN